MTRRILAIAGLVIALGAVAVVVIAIWPDRAGNGDSSSIGSSRPGEHDGSPVGRQSVGTFVSKDAQRFALRPVTGPLPVHYRFKHPPVSGVLFDVKSGKVLWQRRARLQHPIASLTKMMTALLVAQNNSPKERVRISRKAAHTPGSATGLLPRGRKVPLGPLLQALIMISANDAAVALAEHDGGTVTRFIKKMNREAGAM